MRTPTAHTVYILKEADDTGLSTPIRLAAVQITDRNEDGVTPSEAALWADRMARLEAEMQEEQERR